ncbi:hypothetical protein IV203_028163 [Nitzschia inconspicua]|uniref:Uncharacterized protein n=1 Tax=Nitzschia inconspicua TaxID=303405 RepID=A0A9K3K4J9_9STRA|nr:hypothetical protein IV203_028187 [Nitzschia inconspicua]KAG7337026.1 hypothetical protein IV203_022790 [Nitzschia inconspicua]KAG7344685.1 hypothetical protein IV203_032216 [Nitzschia inconspicua]KAG7370417.1 hypothetical protein IV203_028163 [Nitzschia inconspicua]
MGEESTEQEQPDSKNKLPTYPLALDCRNYERIIHKEDVFSGILRDALIQSKLDLERSLPEFLERPFYNGMLIQYEVKDDPIHGRGLYTTQDLPEGTMVWNGDLASFTNIRDYVYFLRYLPRELQCDVMLWSYPVKDSDREVYLAMDEGSYMNDGGIKDSNIGGNETTTIRDIKAGEHLAENYYEYIDFEGNVKWFHDLRERVFGSGKYTEQGAPPQPIKQNDYHKMLRTDTTSTFTASAVDYLFREMDVLVESSNRMNMTSIITLSFLVVAAFLTKRRVLFKDKLHGL